MFESGQSIPLEAVPEGLRGRVGPDAPDKAKALIAKALLPMPPEQLAVALAVLSRDEDETVASTASSSLRELPDEVKAELVGGSDLPGEVLDGFATAFRDDLELCQQLVINRVTLDTTVAWLARTSRGAVLESIASNQVRLLREPLIIEALIANAATPTPTLARVVETALRGDIDTSTIVGFKPLADAFFADLTSQMAQEQASQEAAEAQDDAAEEVAEERHHEERHHEERGEALAKLEDGALEDAVKQGDGVEHEVLEFLLNGGQPGAEQESDSLQQPLWKLITDMSMPQKVRLAMLGNTEARRILIRDVKKAVSNAVLRSPRLTEKEIAGFAQDKALDGEIIRQIARNREWTKNYQIKNALCWNPKTPPPQVSNFLKSLRRKDLQSLARAREVPNATKRQAKALIEKRG